MGRFALSLARPRHARPRQELVCRPPSALSVLPQVVRLAAASVLRSAPASTGDFVRYGNESTAPAAPADRKQIDGVPEVAEFRRRRRRCDRVVGVGEPKVVEVRHRYDGAALGQAVRNQTTALGPVVRVGGRNFPTYGRR